MFYSLRGGSKVFVETVTSIFPARCPQRIRLCLNYPDHFEVFRPEEATRCTDGVKSVAEVDSSTLNFTSVGAEVLAWVQKPQKFQNSSNLLRYISLLYNMTYKPSGNRLGRR